MRKHIIKNRAKKEAYDLVTVRRYDGIENGMHAWTYLTHAIVIQGDDNVARCLRDENVMYAYGVGNEQPGDINIYSTSRHDFDTIRYKGRTAMYKFIKKMSSLPLEQGGIYFDDDTKYGYRIEDTKELVR
jgi:hypothetical protein